MPGLDQKHAGPLRDHRPSRWHRLSQQQKLVSAKRHHRSYRSPDDPASDTTWLCCLRWNVAIGMPQGHPYGTAVLPATSICLSRFRFRFFIHQPNALRLSSDAVQCPWKFEGFDLQGKTRGTFCCCCCCCRCFLFISGLTLQLFVLAYSLNGMRRGTESTHESLRVCQYRRFSDLVGKYWRHFCFYESADFRHMDICIVEMLFCRMALPGEIFLSLLLFLWYQWRTQVKVGKWKMENVNGMSTHFHFHFHSATEQVVVGDGWWWMMMMMMMTFMRDCSVFFSTATYSILYFAKDFLKTTRFFLLKMKQVMPQRTTVFIICSVAAFIISHYFL